MSCAGRPSAKGITSKAQVGNTRSTRLRACFVRVRVRVRIRVRVRVRVRARVSVRMRVRVRLTLNLTRSA